MRSLLFALCTVLLLAGCGTTGGVQDNDLRSPLDDGYQPGEFLGLVLDARNIYCATADPYRRALALGVIRYAGWPVPSSGVCTNLLSLMQPGELAALEEVDLEQAIEDQKRFQGVGDAGTYPPKSVD